MGYCEPGRVKIDRDVSEPNQFLSTFCSHPKLRDCIPDCRPIQVFINCCTLTTKPIHLKQQVGIMQQNFGKDGCPRHTQQHQPSGRASPTKNNANCRNSRALCSLQTCQQSGTPRRTELRWTSRARGVQLESSDQAALFCPCRLEGNESYPSFCFPEQ